MFEAYAIPPGFMSSEAVCHLLRKLQNAMLTPIYSNPAGWCVVSLSWSDLQSLRVMQRFQPAVYGNPLRFPGDDCFSVCL